MFKKLLTAVGALLVAAMPLASVVAAPTVAIESEVRVANVTGGVTPNYQKATSAKVDDIVRVQVWFHNKEDENSGKTAQNLRVKINVPTTPGKVQTVSSHVQADNSNAVNDNATVNLSLDNATLEFIPGTVMWRHNVGTNANVNYQTQKVSDAVVTDPNGAVVDQNMQPCFNYEATVTAEFRVKAPVVSIQKMVKVDGQKDFVTENSANAGDTLKYVLVVKNESNTVLKEVQVGDNLPPYMTYVKGSTLLINSNTGTTGKVLGDGITTGGITIDNMNPGSTQYVYFKTVLDKTLPCGNNRLRNVGIVRAQGTNQIFNVAFTNVTGSGCGNVTPPPSTPLPQTGAEGAAAGVLGTGALGYSLSAWIRSKKSLLDALKR